MEKKLQENFVRPLGRVSSSTSRSEVVERVILDEDGNAEAELEVTSSWFVLRKNRKLKEQSPEEFFKIKLVAKTALQSHSFVSERLQVLTYVRKRASRSPDGKESHSRSRNVSREESPSSRKTDLQDSSCLHPEISPDSPQKRKEDQGEWQSSQDLFSHLFQGMPLSQLEEVERLLSLYKRTKIARIARSMIKESSDLSQVSSPDFPQSSTVDELIIDSSKSEDSDAAKRLVALADVKKLP
jgi:hypothetical protein